ncbi:MAG: PAAR domain-containing protein [Tannerellaceae bacterium]|nr:PAAR domain-containing protein [Tannerellaceae bacterium]
MAGKPIATIGSMHVCPMVTGVTPHVGGPIIGPGVPGVLINEKPIAVIGDTCTCTGPPDVIVTGCPGVLINGKPVAIVGSMTARGGQIIEGVPGVTISSSAPMKPAVIPLKEIPFPNISTLSRLTAPTKIKEAEEKIREVKALVESEDDKPKKIFNLQWKKEDVAIREDFTEEWIDMTACTQGYKDGESITFKIDPKQDGNIIELTGTVENNQVKVKWQIES